MAFLSSKTVILPTAPARNHGPGTPPLRGCVGLAGRSRPALIKAVTASANARSANSGCAALGRIRVSMQETVTNRQ
jgi:hypothetical protein